jgi:5S rRNA maturation endonuclease (ribonuclease M5)
LSISTSGADTGWCAVPKSLDRVVDALHKTGGAPRQYGGAWKARCPAHEDHDPSLSFRHTGDRTVLYCHASCASEDVLAALRLSMRDLYDEPTGRYLATYEYRDLLGVPVRRVHRKADKKFEQYHVDDADPTVVLYRLPEVAATIAAGRPIWLVEGEEDVHALEQLGAVATTAPAGASNFGKVDVGPLKGAQVIAVVDQDAAGQKWAAEVHRRLDGWAASLTFRAAKVGKDASDHAAAGHGLDDFVAALIGSDASDTRTLVAVAADGMTMKAPRWLWDQRVPAGAITLLAGREGIGKSTISYDLAGRTTRGDLPGIHQGTPRAVGVVASEDSWESVILPRLFAARADLRHIYKVEARTEEGRYETISAPADLVQLAQLVDRHGLALVVLDPIMSVIHGSLDTHKDRDVRQALDPLSRFCADTGVAVLGLIHVNKTTHTDPLNAVMGSRAFSAVARSVLFAMLDPEAENDDRYLLGHAKSNLGPKQPTERYHLAEHKVELDKPGDGDPYIVTSKVVWDGTDARTLRDAMETPRPGPRGAGSGGAGHPGRRVDHRAGRRGRLTGPVRRVLRRQAGHPALQPDADGRPRAAHPTRPRPLRGRATECCTRCCTLSGDTHSATTAANAA